MIWKERVTSVAAEYDAFPGWLAVVVQVPTLTRVITKPETVQTEGVVDASETAKPELAVGATVTEPLLSNWFDG